MISIEVHPSKYKSYKKVIPLINKVNIKEKKQNQTISTVSTLKLPPQTHFPLLGTQHQLLRVKLGVQEKSSISLGLYGINKALLSSKIMGTIINDHIANQTTYK